MKFKEMAFSSYYEAIVAELRGAIQRYNTVWEEVMCRKPVERDLYLATVEQHRIAVVVLACALLEQAINFYVCTKCDSARFKTLRNRRGYKPSLFEKWAEFPKTFVKGYEFDESGELGRDLKALIDRRNRIMHSKPNLSIDSKIRHEGYEPKIVLNEHDFVGRCASLPYRLIEHVLTFDDAFPEMSSLQTRCGTVNNQFEAAQFRINHFIKRFPLVVNEIMQQGYDEARATKFAHLIGSVPSLDGEGNVLVATDRHFVVLKPLRFFGKTGANFCMQDFEG
jgi:hypothetical protein